MMITAQLQSKTPSNPQTGNKAKVVFFWDYDTQWGADRSRGKGGAKFWGMQEFEYTDIILDIHATYQIPACFAVVGSAALPGKRPYHDPQQIRQIYNNGHEVASHSLKHEWLPALTENALIENLKTSKDILEQCIGTQIHSFVPPYNQPFTYPRRLAIAASEYYEVGHKIITLPKLCHALKETGYTFARVSYYSPLAYFVNRLCGVHLNTLGELETIAGISCIRINTPCGFGPKNLEAVKHAMKNRRGIVVIHAHPHSIKNNDFQNQEYLIPFLKTLAEFRDRQDIEIILPRELAQKVG